MDTRRDVETSTKLVTTNAHRFQRASLIQNVATTIFEMPAEEIVFERTRKGSNRTSDGQFR